jgi:hypothetical protein
MDLEERRPPALPFALDTGDLLEPEPSLAVEDGVAYAVRGPARRLPPLLTVAWTDEPPGATLDDVVGEELARTLIGGDDALLVDAEPTTVGGVAAQRTLTVHRGPDGLPTAAEQWRLLAAGRRWTVSAMTALKDQPELGPRLAAVAATFRVTGEA